MTVSMSNTINKGYTEKIVHYLIFSMRQLYLLKITDESQLFKSDFQCK